MDTSAFRPGPERLLLAAGALGAGRSRPGGTGKGGGTGLQLWIRPLEGDAFAVDVGAEATVRDLAEAALQGEALSDLSVPLADLGISSEAVVEQRARPSFRWQYLRIYDMPYTVPSPITDPRWPEGCSPPDKPEAVVSADGRTVTSTAESQGACEGNLVSDRTFQRGYFRFNFRCDQSASVVTGSGCQNVGMVLGVCTETRARLISGGGRCFCVSGPGQQWRLNCSIGDTETEVRGCWRNWLEQKPALEWPLPEGAVIRLELALGEAGRACTFHVDDVLVADYRELPHEPLRVAISFHHPGWSLTLL
eukprot:TRINITY_DN31119_c0_g1_i3.p1 TRINITY_DN31119_c0_g1~~TRINITY_DN31119_c0_g1_i3.p1  ORF type:complete len:307 (+),score=62.01 TRINITY_DN31119_c0_g1_i3:120-1040(+)